MQTIVQCKLCYRIKIDERGFRNMGQEMILKRYTGKDVSHGICADCFFEIYRTRSARISDRRKVS
jgi:hypothetical protein